MMIDTFCDECKSPIRINGFKAKTYKTHFCNMKCASKYKERFNGENHILFSKVEVHCSNCSSSILKHKHKIKDGKEYYCNRKCMSEHRNKIGFYKKENNFNYQGKNTSFICAYCGKESKLKCSALLKASKNHYCSKECYKKHSSQRIGEMAYNWKGGKSPLQSNIRHLTQTKEWRLKVFERDNYICQKCNCGSNKLEAHHIEGVTQIINLYEIKTVEDALKVDLLWNIDIGITLCKKCHKTFHNLFGVYNFTSENLMEYLNYKQELCR
jgi:hypothetical protein